uniref:sterol 24-C-methyltransferase-like n=1 Tax=Styela clava TaxID=7725 RepID=UPI00193AD9BC|nr:sterol 24-C-methyltransferase-like [Styela clava]
MSEDWRESGTAERYLWTPKYPSSIAEFVISRLRKMNLYKDSKKFDLILDVGCGYGESLKYYVPFFHKAIGFDISEEQIEKARELNEFNNVTFLLGKGNMFPVDDNSVDLIVCVGTAHYLDAAHFVTECKRVIKKGGLVAIYSHEFADLHIENVVDRASLPGYKILNENFLSPMHNDFFSMDHPVCEWINRYRGIYNMPSSMDKQRSDNLALDYHLNLRELKNMFLSSPVYRNHHISFDEESAPLTLMGENLKDLAKVSGCKDEDLNLRLTLSLFFVFLY